VPSLLNRHWAESVLSVFAVLIAGISLWIAIDTERTNRQMVAEAAWPFLQIYNSAHGREGQPLLSLNVANAGVGPAKIESLEVFWQGKPYGGALDLLKACCGFESGGGLGPRGLSTSQVTGTVLRAGDWIALISNVRTPDNSALYDAFNSARNRFTYRVCYCSVFNECWVSDGHDLNPPRVRTCPQPAVPYLE
jgi:hypothetical protein